MTPTVCGKVPALQSLPSSAWAEAPGTSTNATGRCKSAGGGLHRRQGVPRPQAFLGELLHLLAESSNLRFRRFAQGGLPKVVCPRSKEGSKLPRGCLAVSQQPRAVLHFPKPAVLLHKVLGQPMPREERLGTSTLCPPGPCFKVRVAILPPEARLWCALSLSAAPDTQTQALTWLWGGRLKVCPPVAQPLDQLTAQPVLDHLYGSL